MLAKAFAGDPSPLDWKPIRAGVSADGTQGFTYGFATRTAKDKPPTFSKYLSYWVKRPEGWRVAAYKLVPREAGEAPADLRPAALPERIVKPNVDAAALAAYRDELDKTERAFSDESQVDGLGAAFRKYGSADAMNVGGGADFTYGNEAIAAGVRDRQGEPAALGARRRAGRLERRSRHHIWIFAAQRRRATRTARENSLVHCVAPGFAPSALALRRRVDTAFYAARKSRELSGSRDFPFNEGSVSFDESKSGRARLFA